MFAYALLETELGVMLGAVNQSDNQNPAAALPSFVGFPDVAVTVGCRIVGQTTAARVDRFLDRAARFVRIAGNRTRCRISGGKDSHSLITVQTEFERDGLTGTDDVDRRQIINRLEESGEVINDLITGNGICRVASQIGCRAVDGLEADG